MKFDRTPLRPGVLAELAGYPQVQQECQDLAQDIAADARGLAPRASGQLASAGIGIERTQDPRTKVGGYIVGWTPQGWYGWLVEAGTEDTPAQPHLVPAAVKHGAVGGDG